jgi:hypothetical protein
VKAITSVSDGIIIATLQDDVAEAGNTITLTPGPVNGEAVSWNTCTSISKTKFQSVVDALTKNNTTACP